jgi:hypothetical protein
MMDIVDDCNVNFDHHIVNIEYIDVLIKFLVLDWYE